MIRIMYLLGEPTGPTVGHLQLFQEKMTYARQMLGGGGGGRWWVGLELTEPLSVADRADKGWAVKRARPSKKV